ncbi:MAG: OmpA family protein, partial [Candidatus Adiutrix sp.]|nr:OmpA family protein [Candidatus Adiutrix sp.]
VQGQASLSWRETFKEKVLALSGISRLDVSRLEDDAESRRIKELLAGLDRVVIRFPVGLDQPIPEDRDTLNRAVEDLVALEKLAGSMGLAVSLTIYGYTDLSGQAKRNYELSQARARALAALLYERGSTIALSTFGLGPDPAEEEAGPQTPAQKKAAAQASRRIELKVKLDRPRVTVDLD